MEHAIEIHHNIPETDYNQELLDTVLKGVEQSNQSEEYHKMNFLGILNANLLLISG